MLVYKKAELIGQDFHDLFHPFCTKAQCLLDIYTHANFWEKTLTTIEAEEKQVLDYSDLASLSKTIDLEFFSRKDGSSLAVSLTVTPVLDKSRSLSIIVSIKDVSENVHLMNIKQDIVSTVSHEMRTPLQAISGAINILGNEANRPLIEKTVPIGYESINIATRNIARLSRIINDVLIIDEIRKGKLLLNLEEVSVADLLNEAVDQFADWAKASDIELRVSESHGSVLVDKQRLGQVFRYLLSNAIKFTPNGKKVITLSASLTCEDGNPEERLVEFVVKDNGIGIPEDKLEAIFDSFVLLDASDNRAYSGVGLGLSVAKGLVVAHGGRIWAESQMGQGTAIKFRIKACHSTKYK